MASRMTQATDTRFFFAIRSKAAWSTDGIETEVRTVGRLLGFSVRLGIRERLAFNVAPSYTTSVRTQPLSATIANSRRTGRAHLLNADVRCAMTACRLHRCQPPRDNLR